MDKKLVNTIDGTEALRSECRYIKGNFYKIGDATIQNSGQCYEVDGKFCRADTGYIVYDHGAERYVKKVDSLIYGVIGIKDDLEKFVFGFFSENISFNVLVIDSNSDVHNAIMPDIFENTYYKEKLNNGNFYHLSSLNALEFIDKSISQSLKRSLPYDCAGHMAESIRLHNENCDLTPSSTINDYGHYLDKLSFGLEFETVNGFIPKRITNSLGVLPLRDGSISGLEYVTIPLHGKKGLQTVVETCKELAKRTTHNEDCSLHIHFGGIPRTEEYLISLFKILCMVQDDMFSLFPLYKKENYGIKRKCYTKPLPVLDVYAAMDTKITSEKDIKNNFGEIYKYLSMGGDYNNFSNLDEVTCHPADPEARSKWNIKTRYHWVNLIPIIFGNKKTVEFRIHTATHDHNKVINFMFVCAAILKYAEKYQTEILSNSSIFRGLNLEKIITSQYNDTRKLKENLKNYFRNRSIVTQRQIKAGNVIGDESSIRVNNMEWGNNSSFLDTSSYVTINEPPIEGQLLERLQELQQELYVGDPGHREQVGELIIEQLNVDEDAEEVEDE